MRPADRVHGTKLDTAGLTLFASRTYRIGVQTLWADDATGEWFVSIQNRTYASIVPVPPEKVELWKTLLTSNSTA